jgi:hypothetical protein
VEDLQDVVSTEDGGDAAEMVAVGVAKDHRSDWGRPRNEFLNRPQRPDALAIPVASVIHDALVVVSPDDATQPSANIGHTDEDSARLRFERMVRSSKLNYSDEYGAATE